MLTLSVYLTLIRSALMSGVWVWDCQAGRQAGWGSDVCLHTVLFVQGGTRFHNFIGYFLFTLNSFPRLNSEISPHSCTGDSMVSSEARGARPSLSTSICSLARRNFTRDNHWNNTLSRQTGFLLKHWWINLSGVIELFLYFEIGDRSSINSYHQ